MGNWRERAPGRIAGDALMFEVAVGLAVTWLRGQDEHLGVMLPSVVETKLIEEFGKLTRQEARAIRQSAERVIEQEIVLSERP